MNATSARESNHFGIADPRFADIFDIYAEPGRCRRTSSHDGGRGAKTPPTGHPYRLLAAYSADGDTHPHFLGDFMTLCAAWNIAADCLTYEIHGWIPESAQPIAQDLILVAVVNEARGDRCAVAVGGQWTWYETGDPHEAIALAFAVN